MADVPPPVLGSVYVTALHAGAADATAARAAQRSVVAETMVSDDAGKLRCVERTESNVYPEQT